MPSKGEHNMTMYTGLARVARKTGYPVVERSGWKTRGHGQMGTIRSIICHHTASANTGNAPALGYVESNRGALPGPLAQYVLGRDGTIFVVAAGLCWHAGKVGKAAHGNKHAIGIEAENDGRGEKWGPAQYDSYVKLCRALRDEFKLPTSAILGHKEVGIPKGRKIDPTFDMGAFRKYVAKGEYLDSDKVGTVKPAGSVSKPAAKPKPAAKVKQNSGNSKASNIAIAKTLNALGYKAGAPDGVPGPYLRDGVKAYQRAQTYFPGMKIDGDWGPMCQAHFDWTRKVLQPNLNKWKAVQRDGLLAHDGDLAKLTKARVKAVQADNRPVYAKVGGKVVDGEPGPITCQLLGIHKHPSA